MTSDASRARRTASRPRARPASRARTGSSSTTCGATSVCSARDMAAHLQREDRQRQHERRSRTAASCRPVRDSACVARLAITGSSAMPQIGHAPGRPGGSPGASDRCRSPAGAGATSAAPPLLEVRFPVPLKIFRGIGRNRNNRSGRGIRSDALPSRDRRSCRRPDRPPFPHRRCHGVRAAQNHRRAHALCLVRFSASCSWSYPFGKHRR